MFGSVAVSSHSTDDHAAIVGPDKIEELRALAEPLAGIRVLILSSLAASVAVRSLLQSSVPLLLDLGLNARWQQVRVPAEFMDLDRDMRSALSGTAVEWSSRREAEWWQFNLANAQLFDEDLDIVIVHHTASVGLHAAVTQLRGGPPSGIWLWESHRDYYAAAPEAWQLIRHHADSFHGSIYDYKPFIRIDAPTKLKVVIPPGVDPLGPRSRPVPRDVRETILSQRGIDIARPLIAQIVLSMRDDDPMRVLETYALVKAIRPDVQLVIANLLSDGAELNAALTRLRGEVRSEADVHVLTETDRVGNVELSALRDQADVLVHQGFPRGISLELLEEMWQARPIVSGRSAMAEAVLISGRTGVLADTPSQQARAIVRLLERPAEAQRIGAAAHDLVAKRFLVTHNIAAYLRLFRRVLRRTSPRSQRS